MTIEEFARACYDYGMKYHASVTSWGRSPARERTLSGGIVGGPHSWWRGLDVVYDSGPNRGDATHPQMPHSCPACSDFGLKVIHEKGHDHLQPANFPAGPQVSYDGETKTWV
jgi:hypothetical protein